MATPKGYVSPFSTAAGAAKKTAVSSKSPFKAGAAVGPNPWQPVLSFGQTLIDIVSTPLYAVEGAIAGAQKGKNPIVSAAENSVAWTQGKRPQTGSDILKNAGMSNDFWSSLAADIALDPLTYTPGVVISAPIKAALAGTKYAAKGIAASAKGATSVKSAGAKAGAPVEAIVKAPLEKKAGVSPAIAAKRVEAEKEMQRFVYQPVQLQGGRSVTEAMSQMLASGLEAGYKGARMSISKSLLKEAERKIGKAEKKAGKIEAAKALEVVTPKIAQDVVDATDNVAKDAATVATDVANVAKDPALEAVNIPVVDRAPTMVTPLELQSTLKPLSKTTAKEIEASLNKIDKIVRSTTGVRQSGDAVKGRVSQVLSDAVQNTYKSFKNLDANIVKNLDLSVTPNSGIDSLTLLRQYATTSDPAKLAIIKAYGNVPVGVISGKPATLNDVLTRKEFAGPIRNIDKDTRIKIDNIVRSVVKIAREGDKGIEFVNKRDLQSIIGEPAADALAKTGALDPSKTTDNAALKAVLDGVATAGEKKYNNFSEFIAGIRAGDIIKQDALEKVLRAIDPEHKALNEIDSAIESPNTVSVLRSALVSSGVNTVETSLRNLAHLNPESFMKATGMSASDVAFVTTNDVLKGIQDLDFAASAATREAAGQRLIDARDVQGGNELVDDAVEVLGRALGVRAGEIFKGNETGVSLLGEKFKKFFGATGKSEAFLVNQFNQYVETDMLGFLLGRETYRRGKAKKAITATSRRNIARIDDFIARTGLVEDVLLSVFKVRPVHVLAIKKLKGDLKNAYKHYVTVGDTASVFNKSPESATLFSRLMFPAEQFPNLKINPKMDSISFQTMGDIVSAALRSLERGEEFNVTEMVKALSTPADGKVWGKPYKDIVKANAEDFVNFIKDNVDDFAAIHKSKLQAEIVDSATPAFKFADAIVDAMVGAFAAMKDKGITSAVERQQVVHDWMMKFAAISDIFAISNGSVAREVFRSTAKVFLEISDLNKADGVASIWRDKMKAIASNRADLSEIYPEFMETMARNYKWSHTTDSIAPAMKGPVADAAKAEFAKAKDVYELSVKAINNQMSPAEVLEWRKSHIEAEEMLNAARAKMDKAGLETLYWNGDSWISRDRFNRKVALSKAAQSPDRFIYTASGVVDIARYMVDSPAVIPTFAKFGTKHTKETRAYWNQINKQVRSKNAANNKANAQEEVLAKMDEINALYPDEPAEGMRYANSLVQQKRFEEGVIKVSEETAPIEMDVPTVQGASNYRDMAQEGISRGARFGQKFQAAAGFSDLQSYVFNAESTLRNAVSSASNVMAHVFTLYRSAKLKPTDLDAAVTAATTKVYPKDPTTDVVGEMSRQLGKLWDSMIKHVEERGITNQYLKRSFDLHKIGYWIVDWESSQGPKSITDILEQLPLGSPPAKLVADTSQVGLNRLKDWEDRRAEFLELVEKNQEAAGGVGLLQRVVAAIQHASSEMQLMDDFVEDFGPKNYFPGMSEEAARKAAIESGEFVKITSLNKTGFSLTQYLPEDAIFPREIAKQFFAAERHYNYVMENHMAKWVQNMMGILNFFKFTQTSARPGHWMTILIGDVGTSLMRGSNPATAIPATRLAMKWAGEKAVADWTKGGDDKRWEAVVRGMKAFNKGGREILDSADGTYTFMVGGKKLKLNEEDLRALFEDANVELGDVIATDNMVAAAELQTVASGTDQGVAFNKMMAENLQTDSVKAGARRALVKTMKVPGDIVAALGNVPRIMTALDVMGSRNWGSTREMMAAVNKEVRIYHPTIQSLSPIERQKIRPLFSYYTWLRGAHVAFLQLAVNHTATMLIPSKIFYNQALANEMGPGSIGNLWGNKEQTPGYLDYSVYGPTTAGPRGGIVYRPSALPLDLLDTWNIQYDPSKTVDQNTFANIAGVGQSVIGKNINMVAQPGIEWITGTDPSTGKPSTVKDIGTAADSLLSNIGTNQLFQGLGLYTPLNKGPEAKNPITERDRQLKLLNFFTGQRVMDVGTPSNIKNARSEETARIRRLIEQLQQGQ